MERRKLNRRDFLRLSAAAATGAIAAACAPAAPQVIEVEKEVPVVKEVVKEVPVEKVVEKVVKETVVVEKVVKPVEKVEIRYQTREPEMPEEEELLFRELYPKFQEEHPNIEVKHISAPPGHYDKVIAAAVAGNAPDLFGACDTSLVTFTARGMCLDLQPYIDLDLDELALDDYPSGTFDIFSNPDTGHIHWMPRHAGAFTIWYNVEMFEEMGLDLLPKRYGSENIDHDDYEEIGQQFVRREKPQRWGSILSYGVGCVPCTCGHFWSFETNIVDPEDLTRCALSDPPALECLEWIRRQYQDTHMYARGEEMGGMAVTQMFIAQKVAMLEMGQWSLGTIAEAARFKWDIAPWPNGPTGKSYNLGPADGYCIWNGTRHPDASWEFLKFLQSPLWHKGLARLLTKMPARLSICPYFYKVVRETYPIFEDMNLEVWGDAMERGIMKSEDFFWPEIEASLEMLTPVLEEICVLGNEPVSYIKEACEKVTKLNRGEIQIGG